MQPAFCLGFYREQCTFGLFVLIGISSRVEGVGTILLIAVTGLPAYIGIFAGILPLIIKTTGVEIAVVGAAVTAVVTSRNLITESAFCEVGTRSAIKQSIRTCRSMKRDITLFIRFSDDVDGTG